MTGGLIQLLVTVYMNTPHFLNICAAGSQLGHGSVQPCNNSTGNSDGNYVIITVHSPVPLHRNVNKFKNTEFDISTQSVCAA